MDRSIRRQIRRPRPLAGYTGLILSAWRKSFRMYTRDRMRLTPVALEPTIFPGRLGDETFGASSGRSRRAASSSQEPDPSGAPGVPHFPLPASAQRGSFSGSYLPISSSSSRRPSSPHSVCRGGLRGWESDCRPLVWHTGRETDSACRRSNAPVPHVPGVPPVSAIQLNCSAH